MWHLKAVGTSSPCSNSTKKGLSFYLQLLHEVFFHSGLQLLTNNTDTGRLHQPQGAFNAQGWSQVTGHERTRVEVTGTGTASLWTFKTHRGTCSTNPSLCPCPPLWQSSRQPRCLQRTARSSLAGAPKPGWVSLRVPPPSQRRPPEPHERSLSPRQPQRSTALQPASHQAFSIKPAEGGKKGLKADKMTDGKSAESCYHPSSQTSHLWCDAGNYKVTAWQSGICYPEGKKNKQSYVFKSSTPSIHTTLKTQKIIFWKCVEPWCEIPAYSLTSYKNKVRLIDLIIHNELLISLYKV